MDELGYSTIRVGGSDAFDFLQAQLAGDLNDVPDAGIMLAAWCNPKGRVICVFRVAKSGEDYLLTLPSALADGVVKRLTMFRFRAKVELAMEPATPEQLGLDGALDDWRLANLRAGIPEIGLAQSEQFTPHMLNLDLLGAASIDKGCYPGQEIVARTHYRGATKRRMLRFESRAPVAPGDKVVDGDRSVGDVVNTVGNDLLAIVSLDKADADLSINGGPLRNVELPYL